MSIDFMRRAIADVYPGDEWKDKVAKMWEGQVVAVYHRFLKEGILDNGPDKPKPRGIDRMTEIKDDTFPETGVQLSIFDLLEEANNG